MYGSRLGFGFALSSAVFKVELKAMHPDVVGQASGLTLEIGYFLAPSVFPSSETLSI